MSPDRKPPTSSSPTGPPPLPRSSPSVTPSPPSTPPPDPNNPDEIRADIEVTRTELGDTVEVLAAKADLKRRSKDAVAGAKARARDKASEAKGRALDATHTASDQLPPRAREVTDALRRHRATAVAAAAGGVLAVAGTVAAVRRWTDGRAQGRRNEGRAQKRWRHTRWTGRALRTGAALAVAARRPG
ncbi:DUF3618 domain-containing protein [Phytohabitans suffuscus]|uniref:DUF3618 domain-containing protein n=1 Tax=Phytohabitans suffuscus TaxID=624315 RepID=A0A6F8YU08_9ACTN|nr:DUF3618 domain-containing protein [Phytohabitans suffuscus]BCB89463.1 hypothetical protein Psuf_067760 [Phytohabitans suffuscus]